MIFLCVVLFIPWTTTADNKTKRTLSQELYNYGESTPVLTYNENSASKPLTYFNQPQPIKEYEQPFGIKPSNQPILYDYQQHPASIVFVKQPLPSNNFNQNLQNQRYPEPVSSTTTLQNFMPSEAVILPLQRQNSPIYENNGQFTPNIKFSTFHNSQQPPRKYIHPLGGRFIYNQNQVPYIHHPQINRDAFLPRQQLSPNSVYNTHQFQQVSERPVIAGYHNSYIPRENIIDPNIHSKIVASQIRHPLRAISSHKATLNKEEGSKSDDNNPVKQVDEAGTIEENVDEDDSSEQEQDPAYSKYSFDYEENDNYDKSSPETDYDDESDNKRDTKVSRKYPKKSSRKEALNHNTGRHRDSKRSRSEAEKATKKPKMAYKTVKYSREVNRNPKADFLEGRHTENVPVTHKHRFFKEKWYLSKNAENHHEAI